MYSALTTCSNVFCFPEGNESSQMHIPLLSMLFTLSEHMHVPYGDIYISFLGTDSTILTFENEVPK